MEKDYVTKKYLNDSLKDFVTKDDLRRELHLTELSLSKDLNNRINDTYWKLIPVVIGGMALVNGIFYVAYTVGG